MDKKEMIQKAYDLGFKFEQDFRGCAQCAVAAVQDTLGLRNDHIYKAASGLAGGTGECIDGNCGGYSGSVMAMSTLFGRTRPEEGTTKGREWKYDSFRMAAAIHDKYVEKYGDITCRGIQTKIYGRAYDLRKDEDKQGFRDAGAHELEDKCCAVVGDGARWAVELILDEIEKQGISLDEVKDMTCKSE